MTSRGLNATWDWSPEIWGWTPSLGRWSPEYGEPKHHVFFEVSTDGVEPGEAYDYWRDLAYYHFDAFQRPKGSAFKARAQVVVSPAGNLYVFRSHGVSGQRTAGQIRADGGDELTLGLVLAGKRNHRDETDGVVVAAAGDFFAYDAAKPSRLEWDDHQGVQLLLPRKRVEAAIGGDLPPVSDLLRVLKRSNLSPFLRSHLKLLARKIGSLTPAERVTMFEYTVELSLAVLREAAAKENHAPAMGSWGYFNAAKQVIAARLADPGLDPGMIAQELGCSRATLYRAFSQYEMTVAEYIREARLEEAMRRLRSSSPRQSIEAIAAQCGFTDAKHFRKLFRARFGMSPKDARALYEADATVHRGKEDPRD